VNCDKATRQLPGFKPQWNARRGAAELYEAYCKQGLCVDEFEGPRYRRIDHIQHLISTGFLQPSLRWAMQPEALMAGD
jgi:hypothetical protein